MGNIETGVDKLVDLIDKKKRIALDQAAKSLGVSTVLVQEWADFLEEDGLISVEYSLSRVWLVEKKLTKKEVEKKEHEYEGKKDSFIRKVETTLKSLDKDTLGFEKMKAEFKDLKKEIGGEIGYVKKELKELEYFENLKKSIDKDIEKQKAEYEKLMEHSHREIKTEERRYQEMIAQIAREKSKVLKEEKDIKSLEDKETVLMQQIDQMNQTVADIRKELRTDNRRIEISDATIKKLDRFVKQIEQRMKSKKNDAILPLIKLSEEHRSRIVNLQNGMINKLNKKMEEVDKYKNQNTKVYKNLQKFFNKKEDAEKLLNKIESDKLKLKKEYQDLVKKAHGFNAISKKATVKKHMAEMDEYYKSIENHKSNIRKEVDKLSKLLKG